MPCTSRISTIDKTVVTDEETLKATLKALGWAHQKIGTSWFVTPKDGQGFELRKSTKGFNAVDVTSDNLSKLNMSYRQTQLQGWAKKQGFMFQVKNSEPQALKIQLQKY